MQTPGLSDFSDSASAAAARWLARRDRGLSGAERAAYEQWLNERAEHAGAIARLERSWSRLDALRALAPATGTVINPDLLAPRRRRAWLWPSALAAAAALAVAALSWWRPLAERDAPVVAMHPGPAQMTLADGSLVELDREAEIELRFTPERRGVRLRRGQAHFTVAKDAARPFVVAAEQFAVRAVGTAFTVQLEEQAVSVLVTEGTVQLGELHTAGDVGSPARDLTAVTAGQHAFVRGGEAGAEPRLVIRDVARTEIDEAVAWQRMRLDFDNLPLREVVEIFNRFNARQLLIADRPTGELLVGGSFRADNVEPFVRLLDTGLGVSVTPQGDALVLCRR